MRSSSPRKFALLNKQHKKTASGDKAVLNYFLKMNFTDQDFVKLPVANDTRLHNGRFAEQAPS